MSGWRQDGSPKRRPLSRACTKARERSRRDLTRTSSSSTPTSGHSCGLRPCARASATARWTAWTSASPCGRCTCEVQPCGETGGNSAWPRAASSGRSGSGRRSPEDRVLSELALEAGRRSVAGVEGCRWRQAQQLGADAHHLAAQVGLGRLLTDSARKDRVAHERVVRDDVADAARRMTWCVHDCELELAELDLIAIEQVAIGRPEELFGVGRMNRGLAAGQVLEVILAGDVTRMAVGGEDVLDCEAGGLLSELLRWQTGIDDHRLLGARARQDVAVDLAVELDLDNA